VNSKFQKLRWRLSLTFFIPLVLMFGIVGFANVKLDAASQLSKELDETAHDLIDIVNVGDHWVRMQRASYSYTFANGNQNVELGDRKAIYETSRKAVHEKIDRLSKSDTTGRLVDTIQLLKDTRTLSWGTGRRFTKRVAKRCMKK